MVRYDKNRPSLRDFRLFGEVPLAGRTGLPPLWADPINSPHPLFFLISLGKKTKFSFT